MTATHYDAVGYRVGDRCVTVRAFPRDWRRIAVARQQQTRIDGHRQPAHPNVLEQKGVG